MLEDLTLQLQDSARWRREVSGRFPDDSRNQTAIALLERLASEIQTPSFAVDRLRRQGTLTAGMGAVGRNAK